MSKAITNLTLPLVVAEVEQTLGTYPHHPHQQAFANPDLRQELIAYVLTRVHSVYAVVEAEPIVDEPDMSMGDPSTLAGDRAISAEPTETQAQLEAFIHQGIHDLLQQHQNCADLQVPDESDGYLRASHWFG